MEYDIFVCHASSDKPIADEVSKQLEERGLQCWIAPRDILPGLPWSAAIIQAISGCKAMVLVLSEHSNESAHVMRELLAADKRQLPIVPFRVDEVVPSGGVEYFLNTSQYLDAAPEPGDHHYDMLATTLQQILGVSGGSLRTRTRTGASGAKALTELVIPEGGDTAAYETALLATQDMLAARDWTLCLRQCGTLFTKALRHLAVMLLPKMRNRDHAEEIEEAFRHVCGSKDPNAAALPHLVQVYKEERVFDELRKHVASTLHPIKQFPWDKIVELADAAELGNKGKHINEESAREMVYYVKMLLYECELAGGVPGEHQLESAPMLDECPSCHEEIEERWKFCPMCGMAIRLACEECGMNLEMGWKICPRCETRVPQRGAVHDLHESRIREEYRMLCVGAYLDGVANFRERMLMERKRLELGLSEEEAEEIERDCAPANVIDYERLVEGVLVDGRITDAERTFLDAKAKHLKIDKWIAEQIEKSIIALEKHAPDGREQQSEKASS